MVVTRRENELAPATQSMMPVVVSIRRIECDSVSTIKTSFSPRAIPFGPATVLKFAKTASRYYVSDVVVCVLSCAFYRVLFIVCVSSCAFYRGTVMSLIRFTGKLCVFRRPTVAGRALLACRRRRFSQLFSTPPMFVPSLSR
eukprot:COSAG06_NODE_7958_length_2322_cov_105.541610_5_plen_142_part_00